MSGETAGALTERLSFRRAGGGRDALGGAEGGEAVVATVWGSLRPRGGGRWEAVVRAPAAAVAGDWIVRDGRLVVVEAIADPALPDRLLLKLEARS